MAVLEQVNGDFIKIKLEKTSINRIRISKFPFIFFYENKHREKYPKKNLGQEREIEREDLSAWVVRGRWRGGRLGGGGGGGGGVIVSYRDKKLSIFLSFSAGHHDRRFVIAHHKPSDVVFFFLFIMLLKFIVWVQTPTPQRTEPVSQSNR